MGFLVRTILSVLCVNILLQCECQNLKKEPYMSVPRLISAAGYPCEKHRVITEDGYYLQMHRIPAGRRTARRSEPAAKGKKTVLIIHGMMGSSGDFVLMGPEKSLAFILADAGYDVWLGNLRGTDYSSHQSLSKNDPRFWEFSFHENGKYDNPAMIDRVLNVTGLPKLLYLGFSMGTTSFFTMMSERPEYNDKVIAFMALAPAVYLDNIKSMATTLLKTLNLPATLRSEGMMFATLTPQIKKFLVGNLCQSKNPQQNVCTTLIGSIVGEDNEQSDWDILQIALLRVQPASWRQLEHYGKIAMTGAFTLWENGLGGDVKPYNLTNVRVPVLIMYGENDQLTEKSQVMRLAEHLSKYRMLEEVRPGCNWPKFNHLDFVFAKDVGDLLNKPLVKHIDKLYNKYG